MQIDCGNLLMILKAMALQKLVLMDNKKLSVDTFLQKRTYPHP